MQDAKTANSFERGECDDVEVGTEFCEPSIAALENEMASMDTRLGPSGSTNEMN